MQSTIHQLLKKAVSYGASDVHLHHEEIWIRRDGRMEQAYFPSLKPSEAIAEIKESGKGENFTMNGPEGTRIRVHLYSSMGEPCSALRILPAQIPQYSQVNIPPALREASLLDSGLILLAGPTGSGKSTTLASLIQYTSKRRASCIITLEDPAEYDFRTIADSRSMIRQRELNRDFQSYSQGIIEAMREDPDIILVGELRDSEAAKEVLRASETGHLVFTTMHTTSCSQSIDRFLELFPPDARSSARSVLADVLRLVCVQRLIPKAGGGRMAVREILTQNNAVKGLIREGKTYQIDSILQTGQSGGMLVFDAQLAKMVVKGYISERTASRYALNTADLSRYLDHYR